MTSLPPRDFSPSADNVKPSPQPPAHEFDGRQAELIDRVVNLLDPRGNILLGTTFQEASTAVRDGDIQAVRRICGQFAICEQSGKTIRMARSLGRPMRYFLAKRAEGPALVVAGRWLLRASKFPTGHCPPHYVPSQYLFGQKGSKLHAKRN